MGNKTAKPAALSTTSPAIKPKGLSKRAATSPRRQRQLNKAVEKQAKADAKAKAAIRRPSQIPDTRPCVTNNVRDLFEDYEFVRQLGEGHFGKVRLAKHKKTGETAAIKSVLKHKVRRLELLKREVEIMQNLPAHSHVVKYLDTYEDKTYLHIVMEQCKGTELFDRIVENGTLTERDAASIVRQMLVAIEFLHSHGIVHRDIKPENFLFKTDSGSYDDLAVIDFGLSRVVADNSEMDTRVGTPYYIAPEVLNRKYDKACDLWSLGVVIYIMLSGEPPFWANNDVEIFEVIKGGIFGFPSAEWKHISNNAKDLIVKLLCVDPTKRITATQALQHEWISGITSKVTDVSVTVGDAAISASVISSLRRFASLNKFKRAVFHLMAHQLNEKEISELRPHFAALDTDGDGHLTATELTKSMRLYGADPCTEEEVAEMLANLDDDGSGTIDYNEFLAAMLQRNQLYKDDIMLSAFHHFDVTAKGKITADDLMDKLGFRRENDEALVLEIMSQVDENQDGSIDFDEFRKMVRGVLDDQESHDLEFQRSQDMKGVAKSLAATQSEPASDRRTSKPEHRRKHKSKQSSSRTLSTSKQASNRAVSTSKQPSSQTITASNEPSSRVKSTGTAGGKREKSKGKGNGIKS